MQEVGTTGPFRPAAASPPRNAIELAQKKSAHPSSTALNKIFKLAQTAEAGLGIGFYSLHGCVQVEATELSVTARGTAMSLHSLFFFLGHAAGPILYGAGFAHLGASRSVLIGGVVMLLVGLMCARYLRRVR